VPLGLLRPNGGDAIVFVVSAPSLAMPSSHTALLGRPSGRQTQRVILYCCSAVGKGRLIHSFITFVLESSRRKGDSRPRDWRCGGCCGFATHYCRRSRPGLKPTDTSYSSSRRCRRNLDLQWRPRLSVTDHVVRGGGGHRRAVIGDERPAVSRLSRRNGHATSDQRWLQRLGRTVVQSRADREKTYGPPKICSRQTREMPEQAIKGEKGRAAVGADNNCGVGS